MSYSIKRDVLLDIKYSFLRFLQAYFKADNRYTWDKDVRKTKIFIIDKHALDLGVVLKRPAIILNRNTMSWSYVSGNQNAINTGYNSPLLSLVGKPPNVMPENTKVYSDLVAGGLSLTVLSKNGVESERIASIIFTILTGYKDELRKDGIHKVTNVSISNEQIIRQNAEHELIAVNVNLNYYAQKTVIKDETYNYLTVYVNSEIMNESIDYIVDLNGQYIRFLRTLPNNADLRIDYIDAITLNEVFGVELIPTADPQLFKVPNGGTIRSYYTLLKEIIIDIKQNLSEDVTHDFDFLYNTWDYDATQDDDDFDFQE